MKKQLCAAALAAVMALSVCGCQRVPSQKEPQSSAVSGSSEEAVQPPEKAPSERSAFLQAQTDLYDPDLKPSVAPYQVKSDFSNVDNYADMRYAFNEKGKQMLLENGFVVMETGFDEFFSLYEINRYAQKPIFVTTDSMMHTYHLYFSRLLKGIEKEYFCDSLQKLSQTMQEESLAQIQALQGTSWENAAKRNAAFFAVGASLLKGSSEGIPAEVREEVLQELALIEAASGIAPSPVMNIGGGAETPLQEDYSQYIPRGYYVSSEELTRYFKAMMWYGRLSFRQSEDDESRSALLMTVALENSEAMKQWEEIYTVSSFFVGASDDAGVFEYAQAIRESYGGLPEVGKLPGLSTEWERFKAAIALLEPPVINSIPIYDEQLQPDKEEEIKGFRFMGQRSTLDAAVFQQLVYRQVKENANRERRMLPSALDIPAALGSKTAEKLLAETGAPEFAGYSENMASIQSYLADAPDSLWNGSLYGGWLNTLRPLTQERGEGYPQFMQNEAWAAKNLNSFLGSWTELKHDTVLYAKQAYAEMGGGWEEEVDDRGYVEPEPVLYSRLAGLAQATADGLEAYGVLKPSDGENLRLMAELAQKLLTISEKELRDQLLDEEEYELIRTYGGQLEHFWYEALKDEKNGKELFSTDFPAAVVTDVATDPNGSVLEVGSGGIDSIYVIVNIGGSLRIAEGGVFSFYEFEQPLNDRLTDQKWRRMLGIDRFDDAGNYVDMSEDVPRPEWASLFSAGSRN